VSEESNPSAQNSVRVDQHESQESMRDLCKLIISLASGVLALSGTFASKFSGDSGPAVILMIISWGFLAMSIVRGVRAISILADAQQKGNAAWWTPTLEPASNSWWFFRWGVFMLVVYFGWVAICTAISGDAMKTVMRFYFRHF
jgi:hypothetical protein